MRHVSNGAERESPPTDSATNAKGTTSRSLETRSSAGERVRTHRVDSVAPSRAPATGPVRPWHRYLIARVMTLVGAPPLSAALWDGEEIRWSDRVPLATVVVHNAATLRRIALNPFYQFAEQYANGHVDIIGDLVEAIVAVNRSIKASARASLVYSVVSNWLRLPRINTLSASRDNVHHHYDIGNDFYRLWLDEQMAYTCAYFPTAEASLEQAQIAKFDHVCRKLRLKPGERVVEAGCGWGALALHMARHYGVTVKAYNVSREQVAYARRRAEDEGLSDRVEFIEEDWRQIQGQFDAFVSVGMLEHVGKHNYHRLGEVMHRSLTQQGRGLVHSIGRNKPAPVDRWIERRIFPGSYPPSLAEVMRIFEPRDFSVLDVENLRLHYAQTLRHWLSRFEAAGQRVAQMFDDRFLRMWRLYLAGSVAAFETGELQLFQVVFARGSLNDLPWTRAHVYESGPQVAPVGSGA